MTIIWQYDKNISIILLLVLLLFRLLQWYYHNMINYLKTQFWISWKVTSFIHTRLQRNNVMTLYKKRMLLLQYQCFAFFLSVMDYREKRRISKMEKERQVVMGFCFGQKDERGNKTETIENLCFCWNQANQAERVCTVCLQSVKKSKCWWLLIWQPQNIDL